PAKVNPVIPEAVMMVAARVIGNDATITWGGANGNFELNVMMPVMAEALLDSIDLLASSATVLADKTVAGIEADAERALELLEKNVIVVTALNPHIGYDAGSAAAKEAFASGRTVREVVLERGLMTAEELDAALDLRRMTEGGLQ
ncbi:MAG: aspartate ammonia-lyase, partial [Acidimicrobiia bacterium]